MITIAYRGSGGYYFGDLIIFDGLNTAGNTTVIKITGPNLPADGVPLYDLNGISGAGNTAPVDSRNLWIFSWDMSRVDTSKLQTARYTFTAWDREKREVTATTSLVLKRPEFYLKAKPATGRMGDYIELDGMAEKGVNYIKLDVSDPEGRVVHTFIAPVSGLGFFQYGFHVDMPPGQYFVTGTNPSMKKNLKLVLTITASESETTLAARPVETAAQPTVTSVETTSLAISVSPSGTAPAPLSTTAGIATVTLVLALAGIGVVALICRQKK